MVRNRHVPFVLECTDCDVRLTPPGTGRVGVLHTEAGRVPPALGGTNTPSRGSRPTPTPPARFQNLEEFHLCAVPSHSPWPPRPSGPPPWSRPWPRPQPPPRTPRPP